MALNQIKKHVDLLNIVLQKYLKEDFKGYVKSKEITNAEAGFEYLKRGLGAIELDWEQGEKSKEKWRIIFDVLISAIQKTIFFESHLLNSAGAKAFIEKYPLPSKWKSSFEFLDQDLIVSQESNSSSRWSLDRQKIKQKTKQVGDKKYHIKNPVPSYLETEFNFLDSNHRLKILLDAQLEVIGAELFAALTNDPRKTRISWGVLADTPCGPDVNDDNRDYIQLHPYIATEQVSAQELVKPRSLYFPDEVVKGNIELFVYLYLTAQDDHAANNFIRDGEKLIAIDFGRGFYSAELTAYAGTRSAGHISNAADSKLDDWEVVPGRDAFSVQAVDIEVLPALFVRSTKHTRWSVEEAKKHFTPRRWATSTGHFDLTYQENLAKYRAFIKGVILIPAVIKNIIADHMCPNLITAQLLEDYLNKRIETIFEECLKISLFCEIAADEGTYDYLRAEFEKFNQIHAKRPERQVNIDEVIEKFRDKFRTLNDPIERQFFSSTEPLFQVASSSTSRFRRKSV